MAATRAETDAPAPATPHTPARDDQRLKLLEATMKRYQYQADALIEVLHTAQELFGFLSPDLLRHVARRLKLPPSRVYGVATFYHFFTLAPRGAHTCVVCLGTACYVKGSAKILAAVERESGILPGDTTDDARLSLLTARCLGACGIAPAVVYDGVVSGHQAVDDVVERVKGWLADESH
jgi:bidirectional [NiFe] hydrogenase diaphorase subunit